MCVLLSPKGWEVARPEIGAGAHPPLVQLSCVHWLPSSQLIGGFEQAPVALSQTSWVQGLLSEQSTEAPEHTTPPDPFEAQASPVVQPVPSLQGLPAGSATPMHEADALHVSNSVQVLRSSQEVPWASGVATHVPS